MIRNLGLLVAAIAVAALGIYFLVRSGADSPGALIADMGNLHIASFDSPHLPYNSDPPTSGAHVSFIARWGVHEQPIPKELQVHNLEDGGVLVHYNQTVDSETISVMAEIVGQYRDFVILLPSPDMETSIALTAWTRIQKLTEFDSVAIKRFIDAYRGLDHHVR